MRKEKFQLNRKKLRTGRKMQIWISITIIAVTTAILFSCRKSENDTNKTSMTSLFKKQGELTIVRSNGDTIITIDIEIADDESKREIGLMGRTIIGEREGMLFVFEEEHYASFWMRNTILPLDIIFIDKTGRIITIHKNTKPFSDDNYSSTGLALLVLEVNAGLTDKYGIKEGDRISWKTF